MSIYEKMVANFARVFGYNTITAEEANAQLDTMLSATELEEAAERKVKAAHDAQIVALEKERDDAKAEVATLTSTAANTEKTIADLKARIVELEKEPASSHTQGATETQVKTSKYPKYDAVMASYKD